MIIFFSILLLVLMIATLMASYAMGEDDVAQGKGMLYLIIVILVTTGLLGTIIELSHEKGYKDGQVQAIIGNQEYTRQTQPDSTVIWVRINN
jgi:phosphate/sulfate permease